jgi:hypothetical protein
VHRKSKDVIFNVPATTLNFPTPVLPVTGSIPFSARPKISSSLTPPPPTPIGGGSHCGYLVVTMSTGNYLADARQPSDRRKHRARDQRSQSSACRYPGNVPASQPSPTRPPQHHTYIRALYNQDLGYNNVTCYELMRHLWSNYGSITSTEMQANLGTIKLPWSTELPIKSVFTQLGDAMAFSAVGSDTISALSAVRTVYATSSKLASSPPTAATGATYSKPIRPAQVPYPLPYGRRRSPPHHDD